MNDLAERFRQIERNPSPDLWDEITSRPVESTPGDRGLRHRVAAGLVAAIVSLSALAFLFTMFLGESDPDPIGSPQSPLAIRVWTSNNPFDVHFSATFEGEEVELVGIETPGPDLEYPNSTPANLPVGTPIVVEASDGIAVSVFELDPAQGNFGVENGSCLIPGALGVLPGPDDTAFFIYAEGTGWMGGQAFRAETVGDELDHDSALDASSTVDASKLGLAACEEGPENSVGDLETFVTALRDRGHTVDVSPPTPALTGELEVDGNAVSIDGERVWAFEYPSEGEFRRMQRRISPSGDEVGDATLFWSPHFFGDGRLIVVVLGQQRETLQAVEDVLGPQFAGV
jgi:hypothetical protein